VCECVSGACGLCVLWMEVEGGGMHQSRPHQVPQTAATCATETELKLEVT